VGAYCGSNLDTLLMNFRAVLELPSATSWNLKSVLNWLGGTKPLIAAESEHLNDPADLVALSSKTDSGVLDWLVESGLYKAGYGKVRFQFCSHPGRIVLTSRIAHRKPGMHRPRILSMVRD